MEKICWHASCRFHPRNEEVTMNIVSALFRAVGKHRPASANRAWWYSISYANGDRRVYRHCDDSRFLYAPSCRHVQLGAPPQHLRRTERTGAGAPGADDVLQPR
jgi:hypothetical protein